MNWRISQAPLPLLGYVLAHELTLLTHRGHGSDLWSALGRWMPGYDERRARLRKLGRALEQ